MKKSKRGRLGSSVGPISYLARRAKSTQVRQTAPYQHPARAISTLLEHRNPRYVLLFALASLAASAYGFLQGAWPFGLVEVVWAGIAVQRWRHRLAGARSAEGTVARRSA